MHNAYTLFFLRQSVDELTVKESSGPRNDGDGQTIAESNKTKKGKADQRAVMVIRRIELCITMVRMAIDFVMTVAETVVIVQERTAEPMGSLNRASTPLPFYGYLR
ncbi:hypothetical protein VNO77_04803 [Canavalia gladiata]|uniref:Uncharacterized protein n=1 Tax=Canavalia gladiata TaxID=3824 RepID=A0AAN9N290_CANGL